jgi:hypothetical protein
MTDQSSHTAAAEAASPESIDRDGYRDGHPYQGPRLGTGDYYPEGYQPQQVLLLGRDGEVGFEVLQRYEDGLYGLGKVTRTGRTRTRKDGIRYQYDRRMVLSGLTAHDLGKLIQALADGIAGMAG